MNENEISESIADMRMRLESLEHGLKARQRALEVRVGALACLCAVLTVGAFVAGCLLP